jgi:predicted peptidase
MTVACVSTGPGDSTDLQHPTIQQEELEPGRLYTIAIPASYTGENSVPLVLALHYGGHGAPFFGYGVLAGLVEPALRELEAIIVAPDCTGADWTDPQSEEDVIAVLEHVVSSFNIDPQKTLVAGYSMGGIGTWHLAGRHPDRFRAAIVIAGLPPDWLADVEWTVPLYVIHSENDAVLPIETTEAAIEQLNNRGVAVEFVVTQGSNHYDTGQFIGPLRTAVPWIENVWQQ